VIALATAPFLPAGLPVLLALLGLAGLLAGHRDDKPAQADLEAAS
jgi:hypothetical protein